jgi:hypothetical protein
MQKVEGSSPFIRFAGKARKRAPFLPFSLARSGHRVDFESRLASSSSNFASQKPQRWRAGAIRRGGRDGPAQRLVSPERDAAEAAADLADARRSWPLAAGRSGGWASGLAIGELEVCDLAGRVSELL